MKTTCMHWVMKPVRGLWVLAVIAGLGQSTGCTSTSPTVSPETYDAITHVGSPDNLSFGYVPVTNLVAYGDHGVGRLEAGQGLFIVHSGQVFQVDSSFRLTTPPESNDIPYAVVTWFEADRMFDVSRMKGKLFERAIDVRRRVQVPQAIKVEGYFHHVTLDAGEAKKTMNDMTGTLVGFYYPQSLGGHHAPGYHLYFISQDLQLGGHVNNFEIGQARISLDHSPFLHTILPMREFKPAIKLPVNPAAVIEEALSEE